MADRVDFQHGDLTRTEQVTMLGQFDLVTCIDVLEHVLDPRKAIASLGLLVSPDGQIIVDIPNMHAHQTVASDPHHHLFGSIMLQREDAIKAFEEEFPGNKRYTVGYFHPLNWYIEAFQDEGLRVKVLDTVDTNDMEKTSQALGTLQETFKTISRAWSNWRREAVKSLLEKYLTMASNDALHLDAQTYQLKYGVPVYHLRCRKSD